jgi:mono/diheme cytochrome c family protein
VRRLETRLLHLEQTPGTQEVGDQVWRGYTYIWNDEQTDAILAQKNGVDRQLTILDKDAPGGKREQTWHFPSRAECSLCHTTPAKYVLGVNTLQMNKDHNYGGVIANQLKTLEHLGVFTEPLPAPPEELPKLVDYQNSKASLNDRARAYLHSNCAHCHMKWGGGNAEFQLLATLDLADTGTVGVRPSHGNFELDRPAVLLPGDPERSMVYHRMTKLGLGRMPHVASTVIDTEAVQLIHDWLKSFPAEKKTAGAGK